MNKDIVIVFYDDYPNGHPECEKYCINAVRKLGVTVYGIGSDLPATPYKNYVQNRLNRRDSEIKPFHYADYLGYNSIAVLRDVYGITCNKVLKIDTDYVITSKFILNDLFNINDSLIGRDNGYLIRYYPESIPNIFYNAHVLYNVSTNPLSNIVTDEVFNQYLTEYWVHNHYTATGPYLLNKIELPKQPKALIPWTSDPSGWSVGTITEKHPAGALGFHFQSSVSKSMGYKLTDFNLTGDVLTYKVAEL